MTFLDESGPWKGVRVGEPDLVKTCHEIEESGRTVKFVVPYRLPAGATPGSGAEAANAYYYIVVRD